MRNSLATLTIWLPFGLLSCELQEARWLPREGDRIGAVEIRYGGATSGHEARLTNFLHLTAGSVYTEEAVDRDIRALYESGYVEEVRVLAEPIDGDVGLVFEVVSRAPFGPPVFVGNIAFSDVHLARELDFGAGTRSEDMTDGRLQAYAEAIEDFYRREGNKS
jgi:outer membrane protein insertion porin family